MECWLDAFHSKELLYVVLLVFPYCDLYSTTEVCKLAVDSILWVCFLPAHQCHAMIDVTTPVSLSFLRAMLSNTDHDNHYPSLTRSMMAVKGMDVVSYCLPVTIAIYVFCIVCVPLCLFYWFSLSHHVYFYYENRLVNHFCTFLVFDIQFCFA